MKIVVDAMGTDAAPLPEIAGAVRALRDQPDLSILLVGDAGKLKAEVERHRVPRDRLTIVPSTEIIGMDEKPAEALRKKKDSSIAVAARLLREGRGDALVSAGNTGAVAAASLMLIGRARGVRRPAIAALFPSRKGYCVVVDAGANVNVKPVHLCQFGIMGSVYAQKVLGVDRPLVGLLSVGEEDAKGSEVIFEASKLLANAGINYVGHVEGGDILKGNCDVVVTDGFTGNALLKFAESVPGIVFSGLRNEANRDFFVRVGAWLAKAGLRRLKKRWDYAEYGGAPLLGVNNGVIICHGKSNAKAVKNAIRVAAKYVRGDSTQKIIELIGRNCDAE